MRIIRRRIRRRWSAPGCTSRWPLLEPRARRGPPEHQPPTASNKHAGNTPRRRHPTPNHPPRHSGTGRPGRISAGRGLPLDSQVGNPLPRNVLLSPIQSLSGRTAARGPRPLQLPSVTPVAAGSHAGPTRVSTAARIRGELAFVTGASLVTGLGTRGETARGAAELARWLPGGRRGRRSEDHLSGQPEEGTSPPCRLDREPEPGG